MVRTPDADHEPILGMRSAVLPVGIPREIKTAEKRVGLTPSGVRRLREKGISVLVEKGAGEAAGFSNREYESAGARIVQTSAEIYREAGLIQKVKEPLPSEWDSLQPGQILFCFLHLASPEHCDLVQSLMKQRVVAIGFETVKKEGRTILLEPMSEIAGGLAACLAGFFKRCVRVEGKKVVYPADFRKRLQEMGREFPGVLEDFKGGKTIVFGGGTAGTKAAEFLLKRGGEVALVEKREDRRIELRKKFGTSGGRLSVLSLEESRAETLAEAEVWIGCVHVAGERAPLVVSREELARYSAKKQKLIFDVAVDQGGNFPETHATTYQDPLYVDSFGNLRFGVTNIPSLCGLEASEAMERVSLPYTLALAKGWRQAVSEFPELAGGIQVCEGKLLNEAVARAHNLAWEPLAR